MEWIRYVLLKGPNKTGERGEGKTSERGVARQASGLMARLAVGEGNTCKWVRGQDGRVGWGQDLRVLDSCIFPQLSPCRQSVETKIFIRQLSTHIKRIRLHLFVYAIAQWAIKTYEIKSSIYCIGLSKTLHSCIHYLGLCSLLWCS